MAGAAAAGVIGVLMPLSSPSQGVVPGANGRIVFTSDRFDPECDRDDDAKRYCNFEILSMNPDGSDVRRLTNLPDEDREPVWSPDGTKIVWVSRHVDSAGDLWIMNADGSDQRPLIEMPGLDDEPVWSPDGTKVAWRHNVDGDADIFVMNVDGSTPPVNITWDPSRHGQKGNDLDDEATWSPDGQTMVIRSDRGEGTVLYRINATDGSNALRLVDRYSDDPAFSPDGTKVAYRGSGSAGAGLHLIAPDGTAHVEIPMAMDGIDPAWSPDGKLIAYVNRNPIDGDIVERKGNGDIFVMGVDGSNPINITADSPRFDGDPDWQTLYSAPPTTQTTSPTGGNTSTSTTVTTAPHAGQTDESGYALLDDAGAVSVFGKAKGFGNATLPAGQPAVDIEYHPSGGGYWVLGAGGAVKAMGGADHFGDATSKLVGSERTTSLSTTPAGTGYWVFTDTGRALPFGEAAFRGDMAGVKLNGPVLDSVPTPTGKGYYMVASDGGIFTFGDAEFFGSTGDLRLNAPVQSLVPDPDGAGYWLVASDGGVFAFDASFRGSMGGTPLNKPVTGMVAYGNGYLMVAEDGGIFNFSDRPFSGSLGDQQLTRPIVAVAPSASTAG